MSCSESDRPDTTITCRLQERQSGGRTGREPQPRAGADGDDAHAAAERRQQQVPRRGTLAAAAVRRRARRDLPAAPSAAGRCRPCLTPAGCSGPSYRDIDTARLRFRVQILELGLGLQVAVYILDEISWW